MMRLRRTSAIATLFLLAGTATASAECSWVLWFTSGKTTEQTSPTDAFVTQQECAAEMARVASTVRDYKRKYPDGFAYLRCLPESVDPRGPKTQ